MDHTEAINKGAVERYRLGELSAVETEEFETHFFECGQCAKELREAAIFEENARAVFAEDSRNAAHASDPRAKYERGRTPWWALFWRNPWSAAPATAAAMLLCTVVYQARTMRLALAPHAITSYVSLSSSRGQDRVIEVPKNDRSYLLSIDPPLEPYPEYLYTVQDEKNVVRFSVPFHTPPADKPLQIVVPRNQIPSGRYTAILRHPAANGQPETELARYSFILKLD
ncbi:MAG TPA: hypothetical protein VIX89_10015 [Bryobacteraceae bacterium]